MIMAAGNSVFDEILEQHKLMKDKSLKEQLAYYASYYWKHVLVIGAALIFIINMVVTYINAKEEVLCVLFVNTFISDEVDMEAYTQEFALQQDIDLEEYTFNIQHDLWISYENLDQLSAANIQKIMVLSGAAAIDAMIVDDTYLEHNGRLGAFGDLSELFPAETLEKYQDRIIYVDAPDDDKGEYPACIDISDSPLMESPEFPSYFCIIQATPHPENTIAFLDYLMGN